MQTANLFTFNTFLKKIENAIVKVFNSLDLSNINNSETNNFEIYKILENPKDEILFNETVEFLKKHKNIKQKEISLTNNNSLIISID